ncbi:MAG: cytochrome-c oxidase, cbb3-type subunit III, partial [Pseudomonadales bacterium]|nr:cytochrome-c oxidase, cbb3-type subunit III [Pseudomonadales bacterium]
MTSFWSAYIIVLTLITIIGTYWLLFANRSRPADSEAKTGHVYDGIEEYDNPLPAWWLYMFVITGVFGVGYLVAFPGLGSFEGLLKWTQIDEWQREVQRAEARYEPVFAAYRDQTIEQIAADPQAVRMGQRIFANNCSQCHGSDARGSLGFPNLTDDDWIWGGTPEAIHATLVNGRQAAMPPWEAALGEQGVSNVARYVRTLSGAESASAE